MKYFYIALLVCMSMIFGPPEPEPARYSGLFGFALWIKDSIIENEDEEKPDVTSPTAADNGVEKKTDNNTQANPTVKPIALLPRALNIPTSPQQASTGLKSLDQDGNASEADAEKFAHSRTSPRERDDEIIVTPQTVNHTSSQSMPGNQNATAKPIVTNLRAGPQPKSMYGSTTDNSQKNIAADNMNDLTPITCCHACKVEIDNLCKSCSISCCLQWKSYWKDVCCCSKA